MPALQPVARRRAARSSSFRADTLQCMRLRSSITHLLSALSCAFVLGIACTSDDSAQETQGSCAIGSIGCPCTDGGGCDSGLVCQEGTCKGEASGTGSETGTSSGTSTMGGTATMGGTTGTSGTSTSMGASSDPSSSTASFKLDIGVETTTDDPPPEIGCTKIDLLFVLDGSGSMIEERSSLAGIGAFTSIIDTLSGLGEGNIDYRVALTTDNDNGYIAPPGCWDGGEPWIASEGKDPAEVASAFNCAVATFGTNKYEASVGCEHVLTSAVDLLDGDASGFVRDDALLVIVMVTDVDDYGAYDQQGGNDCMIGCATPPTALAELQGRLIDNVKAGEVDGLAAIIVAGDPSQNDGVNFCGQPGSCGCGGLDCGVFHATRLYEFAALLGQNGTVADICDGPMSVPDAVETALTTNINIACEMFDPPT